MVQWGDASDTDHTDQRLLQIPSTLLPLGRWAECEDNSLSQVRTTKYVERCLSPDGDI